MIVCVEDSHWPDPISGKVSDSKLIGADCKNDFRTSCRTQLCLEHHLSVTEAAVE